MNTTLKDHMMQALERLIAIPSPTGYTQQAQQYLMEELARLGFAPYTLHKGGVICDLGGQGNPLMLAAHVDTLGAMVTSIKASGTLAATNIGGLNPNNVETETVTVITRSSGSYSGTFQVENASTHVNKNVNDARAFDGNLEVLLDEVVTTAQATQALGIQSGDIIAVNPRFTVTESGYIKSRFLDDKASASVLLALAKAISTRELVPQRKVYINFTVYEEVGHGGAAGIPDDVRDMISVDMGCVGKDLNCLETQVSICAKDSVGPYNYALVGELIDAAKRAGADYAIDVYPFYGSDVDRTLSAGYDIRHGLIGPGVYASHGYERTHVSGLTATFDLLEAYLTYTNLA